MKTVILFRHGKSDWEAEYGGDHERPLARRGRKAAGRMGSHLARSGPLPDRVVCSSALRARDTVELAAAAGGWPCPREIEPALYGATPDAVLALLRGFDDELGCVLLAGHEPTWSTLTGLLIGGAQLEFPTAAMARIDFRAERWRELDFGGGVLAWLVTPKMLKAD